MYMDKLSIYGKIHHIACCRLKSHASGALRSLVTAGGQLAQALSSGLPELA